MRRQAKALRSSLDPAWGASLSAIVLARWPSQPGQVWAGYWPMSSEIDIRPLLYALADRGPVLLPETPDLNEPLVFRRWHPGDPLRPEEFGTFTPVGEVMLPDVLLVPLLAFDLSGARLGYGRGYYDRTLATLPGHRTIGCAFAAQQVPRVPMEPHDFRLDAIATERDLLFCRE